MRSDATRRGFLVMAGAGAAAVATPGAVAQPATFTTESSGPLVAYVGNVGRSEVSIMVGEQEVVVHDADLVARLVRASGRVVGRD
ncbi:twin-arginine translocation signal domain-containing protein [Kribbella catacumbae]|uniref:twin-arginine translocation signal domain-containing protein n=1 Tax=Kribbella catacumbae TaxID=460086 RepID=UPI0003637667|nr:twin-arginine translocation signal domain-containing protein [Kribbella catacumbae]